MSFPYYSDLKFGNEQASADSLGRLSFSEPVDNKDYNYKTANFNVTPVSEYYYYYIEPTPNSEEVKREMYTALNNAAFSILIESTGKGTACTLSIRYDANEEYFYFAMGTVSSYTGTFGVLTIPSTKTLTLNKKIVGGEATPLATLSLQLKNASDDTNVTENTLNISRSVSSKPLVKIPV